MNTSAALATRARRAWPPSATVTSAARSSATVPASLRRIADNVASRFCAVRTPPRAAFTSALRAAGARPALCS